MSLGRVFLSHSSNDKDYVRYIANYLGRDRCVYDEMCFDVGMKTWDEICHGLSSSDIFVWFISNSSLESDWVKREFIKAKEMSDISSGKMKQIFPLIIDSSITYEDERIPDFIKSGFNSYNLQYIKSNRIACKKIQAQVLKCIFEWDNNYKNRFFLFYGRSKEISEFKKAFDGGQKIKCLVVSGIEGIGKKSYSIKILHDTGIFPDYYEPFSISMDQDDQIDDMIIKLSDLGLGDYSLPEIVKVKTLDDKIRILSELFKEAQKQKEYVLIYDNLAIVNLNGEPRFWFTEALSKIRPEMTVSLLSRAYINFSYSKSHKDFFCVVLKELPYPEWNGLLRVYSKYIGRPLDDEERDYFKGIVTGYPPQIIQCADMVKEHSFEYVKDNIREVILNVSPKVVSLLTAALANIDKKTGYELLAFLSKFGTMPMKVVYDVVGLHPEYKEILIRLKALTVCRVSGVFGEFLEISPLVADYIQRNDFSVSDKVQLYLEKQFENFRKDISDVNEEDFDLLQFYLREYLVKSEDLQVEFRHSNLLYSTIYLKAIRELYNKEKYKKVIDVASYLKENETFIRLELPVQEQIQRFYCMSLAREVDERFYSEVEWYKGQNSFYNVEYNFLRGFMFRQNGNFKEAIERYEKVLLVKKNHRQALRELVACYRGLEDYDNFGELAKENYMNSPENPYNIQPYFEFLLHKRDRERKDVDTINKMLEKIRDLHDIKPIPTYYELNAQYYMYIKENYSKAEQFLKEGYIQFPNSAYILRAYFDYYDFNHDTSGMKDILQKLEKCAENNRSTMIAFKRRSIIFDTYQGKPIESLRRRVDQLTDLGEQARNRFLNRIVSIRKQGK